MRIIPTEYYGDNARWFIGIVKSMPGQDPAGLGRVRVRVFGLHSKSTADIKNSDLPFANVVVPGTYAGTAGTHPPTALKVGAQVYGIFIDGKHSQVPLIIGSIPHKPELRVKFDNDDPNVVVTLPSEVAQSQAGDEHTEETVQLLESVGDTSAEAGEKITEDQANKINSIQSGAGVFDNRVTLIGNTRQEQAFNHLKQYFQRRKHANPGILASAFVGNFIHESGSKLDPSIFGDNGNAVGIAQFNGPRMRALKQFAATNSGGFKNFIVQLKFVEYELEGTHSWVYNYLSNDQTIKEATETVYKWYENPLVSVNFGKAHPEVKSYSSYRARGGIEGFLKRSSRQSSVVRAYHDEYEERLESAKAVMRTYGG